MKRTERPAIRIRRADIEKIKKRAVDEDDLKSVAICNRALSGSAEAVLICQKFIDDEEDEEE